MMTKKPTYEELEQMVKVLKKEVVDLRKGEEVLRGTMHGLGERVKELNCLYAISRINEKRGISLDEILQGTVDLIPAALEYPEITCAQITLERKVFKSSRYEEVQWTQIMDIFAHGKKIGRLEVG
jgi:hypothetical protein